ncbi:uncharacterized protein [Montipora foliosa]|uniref:uncharacterized protein n=1 Tax=Montipora foliosa TaxID=591990 RepID=UPI0035F1F74C
MRNQKIFGSNRHTYGTGHNHCLWTMAATVEEVCKFLEDRCVQGSVISKFQEQKIDGSAVTYSPEYYLVELGMVERGDLYALRSFCERKERLAKDKDAEEQKQFLIEKMKRKKVKNTGGPESQRKKMPPQIHIINIANLR